MSEAKLPASGAGWGLPFPAGALDLELCAGKVGIPTVGQASGFWG